MDNEKIKISITKKGKKKKLVIDKKMVFLFVLVLLMVAAMVYISVKGNNAKFIKIINAPTNPRIKELSVKEREIKVFFEDDDNLTNNIFDNPNFKNFVDNIQSYGKYPIAIGRTGNPNPFPRIQAEEGENNE